MSLFDGISCGQLALHRAGFEPSTYYASEIDKTAIQITQKHFPKTIQLGDVQHVHQMCQLGLYAPGSVDLLIGGSPCQGFSIGGHNDGLLDYRSRLFFDYAMIKNYLKPKYFLLENVRMKKADCDVITALMGIGPIEIDSALFSAQRRKRLYWTNIPIAPIVDRNILWPYVREWSGDHLKAFKLNKTKSRIKMWGNGEGRKNNKGVCPNVTFMDKTYTMTVKQDRAPNNGLVEFEDFCRYLTFNECERLQTLPDDYTAGIPKTKRYHHIGNGWTVDVIAHILKGMQ